MKKSLHIIATIDQPELLENMVERLAYRHSDLGFSKEKMPEGRIALETASTETYVSGTMSIEFDNKEENINMPFITCFLFTCIKGKNDPYQLIWSSSLS